MEVCIPGHPICPKSQTQDEPLQYITDDAAPIQKNHERIQKTKGTTAKTAHLCIANAGGHIKQQAA
jgi:hypothetical protein